VQISPFEVSRLCERFSEYSVLWKFKGDIFLEEGLIILFFFGERDAEGVFIG